MFNNKPTYYKKSKVVQSIDNSLTIVFGNFLEVIEDTKNQFYIALTESAIERLESDVGLVADISLSIESRRSRALAKLRGAITPSVLMVKNMSESYSNGAVDVIENTNNTLEIKFVGVVGVPAALTELQKAINAIIPAHIAITYTFRYNTCAVIKTINCTIAKTKTVHELKDHLI